METIISKLEKQSRPTYYSKTPIEFLYFYRGCQYCWEDTADPIREDEESFLTEEDAMKYVDGLKLEIGFRGVVEKIEFLVEDIDEEEVNLNDINYKSVSSYEAEEIYTTGVFEGEEITGSIIIEWSYEKYVGYARNLVNIGVAGEWPFSDIKYEQDLITGNENRTFKTNYSILLTASEIEGLNEDGLLEAIDIELNRGNWKWNYFKNNPNSLYIRERIKDITDNI